MPISKDDMYKVYNFGIGEGRQIVKDFISGEDIVNIGLDAFSKRDAKRIEHASESELVEFVRNLIDGIEDGVKSQLGRESAAYVKWFRDQYE